MKRLLLAICLLTLTQAAELRDYWGGVRIATPVSDPSYSHTTALYQYYSDMVAQILR